MTRRRVDRRVIVCWTLPGGGSVEVVEIAAVRGTRRDVHGIEVLARDAGSLVPRELRRARAVTPCELAAVAPLLARLEEAGDGGNVTRFPAEWWVQQLGDAVEGAAARDGAAVPCDAFARVAAPASSAPATRAESADVPLVRIRRGALALLG